MSLPHLSWFLYASRHSVWLALLTLYTTYEFYFHLVQSNGCSRFVQFGADQDCHCGAAGCRRKLGVRPTKPKTSSDAALKLVACQVAMSSPKMKAILSGKEVCIGHNIDIFFLAVVHKIDLYLLNFLSFRFIIAPYMVMLLVALLIIILHISSLNKSNILEEEHVMVSFRIALKGEFLT